MCKAGQMACVLARAVVSRSWIWASSAGRPPFFLPPEQGRHESAQVVGARAVRVDVRLLGVGFWKREKREAKNLPLKALRSEEHTSELQSHLNLVCRLLLDKKTLKLYLYTCS